MDAVETWNGAFGVVYCRFRYLGMALLIGGHRWQKKNIDWIDSDNRLTVKKTSIRSMVFRRKKIIEPIIKFY